MQRPLIIYTYTHTLYKCMLKCQVFASQVLKKQCLYSGKHLSNNLPTSTVIIQLLNKFACLAFWSHYCHCTGTYKCCTIAKTTITHHCCFFANSVWCCAVSNECHQTVSPFTCMWPILYIQWCKSHDAPLTFSTSLSGSFLAHKL